MALALDINASAQAMADAKATSGHNYVDAYAGPVMSGDISTGISPAAAAIIAAGVFLAALIFGRKRGR